MYDTKKRATKWRIWGWVYFVWGLGFFFLLLFRFWILFCLFCCDFGLVCYFPPQQLDLNYTNNKFLALYKVYYLFVHTKNFNCTTASQDFYSFSHAISICNRKLRQRWWLILFLHRGTQCWRPPTFYKPLKNIIIKHAAIRCWVEKSAFSSLPPFHIRALLVHLPPKTPFLLAATEFCTHHWQ